MAAMQDPVKKRKKKERPMREIEERLKDTPGYREYINDPDLPSQRPIIRREKTLPPSPIISDIEKWQNERSKAAIKMFLGPRVLGIGHPDSARVTNLLLIDDDKLVISVARGDERGIRQMLWDAYLIVLDIKYLFYAKKVLLKDDTRESQIFYYRQINEGHDEDQINAGIHGFSDGTILYSKNISTEGKDIKNPIIQCPGRFSFRKGLELFTREEFYLGGFEERSRETNKHLVSSLKRDDMNHHNDVVQSIIRYKQLIRRARGDDAVTLNRQEREEIQMQDDEVKMLHLLEELKEEKKNIELERSRLVPRIVQRDLRFFHELDGITELEEREQKLQNQMDEIMAARKAFAKRRQQWEKQPEDDIDVPRFTSYDPRAFRNKHIQKRDSLLRTIDYKVAKAALMRQFEEAHETDEEVSEDDLDESSILTSYRDLKDKLYNHHHSNQGAGRTRYTNHCITRAERLKRGYLLMSTNSIFLVDDAHRNYATATVTYNHTLAGAHAITFEGKKENLIVAILASRRTQIILFKETDRKLHVIGERLTTEDVNHKDEPVKTAYIPENGLLVVLAEDTLTQKMVLLAYDIEKSITKESLDPIFRRTISNVSQGVQDMKYMYVPYLKRNLLVVTSNYMLYFFDANLNPFCDQTIYP